LEEVTMSCRVCQLLLGLLAVGGLLLPLPAAAASLSALDQQFAGKAARAGLLEVQLGQLAEERAQTQDVRNFGAIMAQDHGLAHNALREIARQKDLPLPEELTPAQQGTLNRLQELTGEPFDRQYMREMVKAHARDVEQFHQALDQLDDAELRAWAEDSLPTLEEHLQDAWEIALQLGIDAEAAEEEGRQQAQQEMLQPPMI
jgi:putative membrane protein